MVSLLAGWRITFFHTEFLLTILPEWIYFYVDGFYMSGFCMSGFYMSGFYMNDSPFVGSNGFYMVGFSGNEVDVNWIDSS